MPGGPGIPSLCVGSTGGCRARFATVAGTRIACQNDPVPPRLPPVAIRVVETQELAPRARRITFDGMTSVSSVLPASYVSLWFSDPGEARTATTRTKRSDKRSMTPRWIDATATIMTVDFVLHGSGPASTWAAGAQPGDVIWAGETRGGYAIPEPGTDVILIGDDTAIPAIGSILEDLDRSTRPLAIIEVVDATDERTVSDSRPVDPIWVHRGHDPAQTGLLTMNLLETLEAPADAHWWIAGEREAIRSMRDILVEDRGVRRSHLSLNAHWRLRSTDPR